MSSEGALRHGQPADLELIETFRYEPTGFVRLERHLARLYASAKELGFPYDPEMTGRTLAQSTAGIDTVRRIRLTLNRAGHVSVSSLPFETLAPDRVWKLRIAATILNSADQLLRFKTSRRQAYIQARSEFTVPQADEVLLANERGQLCEGTITNLFAEFGDGVLLTPPVESGLLPGVLRGELLQTGRAQEGVLTEKLLRDAKALYVGNSLRGLIQAKLTIG